MMFYLQVCICGKVGWVHRDNGAIVIMTTPLIAEAFRSAELVGLMGDITRRMHPVPVECVPIKAEAPKELVDLLRIG